MKQTKWFERKFPIIEDNGLLPGIIERLQGTPARLREKINQLNIARIVAPGTGWSNNKEIGHLIDLEPLWLERAKEIVAGTLVLKAADLTNRKTEEANHDDRDMIDLVDEFSNHRKLFIDFLKTLADSDLELSSRHPRLQTPMRIVDLAYFVAEHDDHHMVHLG